MEVKALRIGTIVGVFKTEIIWGNQMVNIVILMSINKKDALLFKEFYEALIYIMTNQDVF